MFIVNNDKKRKTEITEALKVFQKVSCDFIVRGHHHCIFFGCFDDHSIIS